MNNVVLLGDSVFDNGAYTGGGPAVVTHLQAKLPPRWKATLLAVDGSVTADVTRQLAGLPRDATHLVISAGGNDALMRSGFLGEPAESVADVFLRMSVLALDFERDYGQMLEAALDLALPTAVCTVYYPNFLDPAMQQLGVIGLLAFNDCILRTAFQAGVPVIDLRLVCTDPADYANEIEPSAAGGAKIAEAVVRTVTAHNFAKRQTTIYF